MPCNDAIASTTQVTITYISHSCCISTSSSAAAEASLPCIGLTTGGCCCILCVCCYCYGAYTGRLPKPRCLDVWPTTRTPPEYDVSPTVTSQPNRGYASVHASRYTRTGTDMELLQLGSANMADLGLCSKTGSASPPAYQPINAAQSPPPTYGSDDDAYGSGRLR
ncbi:NS22 [Marbled eel reovirus]|nr:NS22 [Marbled eel reovirus]